MCWPGPSRSDRAGRDWWLKQWTEREKITGLVPTSLKIRKEAEDLLGTVAKERSEAAVRELVARLNDRIDRARRSQVDGPRVYLEPFDVERVVAHWRAAREAS